MESSTDRTVSSSPVTSGGNKMFEFSPEESQLTFKTSDKNITVRCSGGKHDRGSSKLKLINLINFKWEVKHYPGRLIACHKECELIAYAITVTKMAKREGVVRVAHLKVAERGLIRGLSSEMLDMQFAHTPGPYYLLGIIERTKLHVHQVVVKGQKVTTVLKVKIVDPLESHTPVCDRINWCPYLRENAFEIDDFASQLLVWTRGPIFQCYSISTLLKSYDDTTELKASDIDEGGFKASNGDAITGSVYSADGTTLALSSTDGMIRFYQVYQHANNCKPRRLHQWKPHDGRPVSSFFFLDNYTKTVGEKVLWKHAITCADNNTEIRVWCCESWECLQTIRLVSPLEQPLNFKAEIDLSSTYLVLSDMDTRQMYVLQIRKGQSGRSSSLPSPSASRAPDQVAEAQWKSLTRSSKVIRRAEQSAIKPHIVSIGEYPVSTTILGFGILYARMGNYLMREQDEDDEDQSLPSCIVIRMFLVQSGSMQDCTLMYDAVEEPDSDLLAAASVNRVDLTTAAIDDGANDNETHTTSSQSSSASSSSSSSSNETTDNNMSHPPSEASDQSKTEQQLAAATAAAAGAKKVVPADDSTDGSRSESNSNNDSREEEEEEEEDEDEDEDEEEDDDDEEAGRSRERKRSNLMQLKMAEAAQKLTEAIGAMSPVTSPADAAATNNSGPTTPASATKVNLMTPESFSTPSGRGSRSAKDSSSVPPTAKDVRIINLSEVPYPEVETIMSQYDRRSRGGRARGGRVVSAASAAPGGSRKNKSSRSVTSTPSANGSACSSVGEGGSSGTTSEDEGGAGGNNTSVASLAGSERVANITDDPDEDEDNREEEEEENPEDEEEEENEEDDGVKPIVVVKGKEKGTRGAAATGLPNGAGGGGEQTKKKVHSSNNVVNVTSTTTTTTLLSVEHFTKILTLDEAEPPTVREKIKSDETVNPNVLSTLFMLANATKQQQQQHMIPPSLGIPGTIPTAPPPANALQAFVNMVNSRAANDEASSKLMAGGKMRKSTNGPTTEAGSESSNASVPPEVPPMPSAEMLASGGSSPSREVQEIMSTKGGGGSSINMMVDDMFQFMCTPGQTQRKDIYDDEEEDDAAAAAAAEEEEEEEQARSSQKAGSSTINRFDEEDGVVQVTSNGPDDTTQEDEADGGKEQGNSTAVNTVVANNDANSEGIISTDEQPTNAREDLNDASILIKKALNLSNVTGEGGVGGGGGGVVEDGVIDTAGGDYVAEECSPSFLQSLQNSLKRSAKAESSSGAAPFQQEVTKSSQQIEALSGKLDRVMELLVGQSRQIEELNGQLEAMKKAKNDENRRYSALVNRVQQTLPKTLETQISCSFAQHGAKLEQTLLSALGNQQTQLVHALSKTLPQTLIAQLPERLAAVMTSEIHQKILSPISGKLDVMQRTMSMDMAEKLKMNEGPMRDTIQRTIRSETMVKAISSSVQAGMRLMLEQVYVESLRTMVLPSFNTIHQEMFRQINASFSEGIKEIMRKVDQHVARVMQTQDRASEMVEILRQVPEKLAASGERTTASAVRAIRENIEKDMRVMQTPLLKTIREQIRQEIEKGFEAQASSLEDSVLSVVRSQSQTPAPSNMDVQEQIKQYLNSGQINKAFHKALLSNDLSLVEFLLERADHKQVFNPCPLEQTVLLSLIQQISADMPNHNDLKHKYLSDAIVSLDFQDPITKEHSPKVMLELITNCQAFMSANPTSSLCTSLKMLVIAVQYMGFKQF